VLEVYKAFLLKVEEGNPERFLLPCDQDPVFEGIASHRVEFIRTYRSEQRRIMDSQKSLADSCLIILKRIFSGIEMRMAISQHAGSNLMNCIFLRKYFKELMDNHSV
jgi:hypothetical protein